MPKAWPELCRYVVYLPGTEWALRLMPIVKQLDELDQFKYWSMLKSYWMSTKCLKTEGPKEIKSVFDWKKQKLWAVALNSLDLRPHCRFCSGAVWGAECFPRAVASGCSGLRKAQVIQEWCERNKRNNLEELGRLNQKMNSADTMQHQKEN